MTKLKLADDLSLPADEAVTQKYGFIGRSGSGKSYASMRLAELFLAHGAQIIALDWVGIWWSLRLAADGKKPGFEHVYIFGGEHADVDLRPESGALMADLVVDKHISVVLDVMHFRKAERTRFATAFAEQFFHRKKTARTACHLFIEEAQAYLPQMVRGEEARMVGVFEDIGKVGRNYGIGSSLISQRPQAINKDVLNQVEVLLAFQTNGPQERKAIAGWTAENTDAGAAMIQELPKLHVGHALAWSPQWLRVAKQIHITERVTYDASSTPTQKAKSIRPKTLAKADLEQLGEQITATIEKAKAEDPKELRKEIMRLKLEADKARAAVNTVVRPTTKADEARGKRITELRQQLAKHQQALEAAMKILVTIKAVDFSARGGEALEQAVTAAVKQITDGVERRINALNDRVKRLQAAAMEAQDGIQKLLLEEVDLTVTVQKQQPFKVAPAQTRSAPLSRPVKSPIGEIDLPPAKLKILNALAFLEGIGVPSAERAQLALLADTTPSSSAYANNLGALRSAGLIDYPGQNRVGLTETGRSLADPGDVPSTSDELHRVLQSKLPPAKWKIIAALVRAYPQPLNKSELAEQADTSPDSSAYANNLGSLRSLGLLDYPAPGQVVAQPVLFLENQ
jgi:hypothetical protein